MNSRLLRIILCVISLSLFSSCNATEEDELQPLSGIVLKMENGELCTSTHERTVIGEFRFEELVFSESYYNDQIELSDGNALTFVDRRQTQVIAELRDMGFQEVDSSDIPRCSVDNQDMGADAR